MTRIALVLAASVAVSSSALAQQATAPADVGSAALRANWQQVTRFITMSAEEFAEADYAYKPVATVRSVGELVGHVAGAQNMMCAAALGEPVPAEDAVEKAAKTKAALVDALKKSTEYCAKAYAQSPDAVTGTTNLFGQTMPRAHALALNAVHNGEHYGNLITYMRMKGMVPPSSRQ